MVGSAGASSAKWYEDRDQVLYWLGQYEKFEDQGPAVAGAEKDVGESLRRAGKATKADLEKVLRWKFADMAGRCARETNELDLERPALVEAVTSAAFACRDDEARLRILVAIRGVGPAVASAILALFDPEHYGVFDIHVCREILGRDPAPDQASDVLQVWAELRRLAAKHRMPARDIEKAIFRKNRAASSASGSG